MSRPIRALAVTLAMCSTLFAGAACGGRSAVQEAAGAYIVVATPSPSTPAEQQKFARSRFVANAGLAAGATYQWIVKPWKAGTFKKGAKGRKAALAKAGLAGTFAYNRLKAARHNAQGDPALAKALAPLAAGIDGLGNLPSRLRNGDEAAASSFADVVGRTKSVSKGMGTPVRNQYPTARQLAAG
ncbi:hypothetical protein [Streptomyces chiangmaiensis]|uniref:Lipoprotein n=1 Tax=Streptomyces chiangmaiensis TaxID=766497 RepID=A0ABU7FDR9_9ACTN|nr:hypothetical protein [Streptomyces chiangmaiensis]MED7822208.1 hypothetical protein [Streptomyces chiangmaiensis]